MALDLASWLPFAKQLERGEKAQHEHNCGPGRKLIVENKDGGYSAWCYRCGEKGWHPHPQPSLSERIAALRRVQDAEDKVEGDPRPPMPAEFDPVAWPSVPLLWLYKAGIDKDMIRGLGFYWCDRLKRVVLPVLNDQDKLVYWQARGFDPDRPKYLNPRVDKPVYKAPSLIEPYGGKVLCLTEDILSAARVGQVVHGWSILGTSLTPSQEAEIVKFGASKVLVWLDPDTAGVKGRRKLVPRLRELGLDASAVRADKDPKFYSREEIKEKLT